MYVLMTIQKHDDDDDTRTNLWFLFLLPQNVVQKLMLDHLLTYKTPKQMEIHYNHVHLVHGKFISASY